MHVNESSENYLETILMLSKKLLSYVPSTLQQSLTLRNQVSV